MPDGSSKFALFFIFVNSKCGRPLAAFFSLIKTPDLHQSEQEQVNNLWQRWGGYVYPSPPRGDTLGGDGPYGPKFGEDAKHI